MTDFTAARVFRSEATNCVTARSMNADGQRIASSLASVLLEIFNTGWTTALICAAASEEFIALSSGMDARYALR